MRCIITSKLLQSQGIHKKGLKKQTETHPITWMAAFLLFLAALYHRRAAQCTHHGNRNLSNNFDSRVL